MAKRAVRIQSEMDQRIRQVAKQRGYQTPSAFIRAAIENELTTGRKLAGIEEQTAVSFDRIAKEMRRVLRSQQAMFALLDALTKAFLTSVPEPPADARERTIAVGHDRYSRLMKTAGYAMNESRTAMRSLEEHSDE